MLPTKIVYCPICQRKVMNAATIGVIPVSGSCLNCNCVIIYHPDTDKTTISKEPERTQSSGKRFYK